MGQAASRKAHDGRASALKPVMVLVMLRWFFDSGYPYHGGGAARGTFFGGWLGVVGFKLARRQWASLETRATTGKSA
jgi:hypothetical protein